MTQPDKTAVSAGGPADWEPILHLGLGPEETPPSFRKVTGDYVDTFEAVGKTFLRVDPAGLTLLTQEAMRDIAHLLRPGHLAQLGSILRDPEASEN